MEDAQIEVVRKLLEIMDEAGLVEIEIEREGLHVRLKKAQAPTAQVAPVAESVAPVAGAAETPARDIPSEHVAITSPMVGTYYAAPSPDADAYVDMGDRVEEEMVVCVIEAMKVFNEIRAETTGRIVEILVNSGDAVEFGQPLFIVDPQG